MQKQNQLSASLIGLIAAMTAVTIVFTLWVRIPFPLTRGYVSLADVAIYFASFAFGPLVGGFAGGVGTGMADMIGGYFPWAPLSLLIHGLQGVVAGWLARKGTLPMILLGWFAGAVLMVSGYFIAAAFIYGVGPASVELLGNTGQVVVGGLGGALLYYTVKKAFPSLTLIGKTQIWEEE